MQWTPFLYLLLSILAIMPTVYAMIYLPTIQRWNVKINALGHDRPRYVRIANDLFAPKYPDFYWLGISYISLSALLFAACAVTVKYARMILVSQM